LRAHESEFRQAGARLAAIGLGDAGYARAFREESGIGFPLLIDADRAAYRMAGLKKASLLHLLRRDNFAALGASGKRWVGELNQRETRV